MVEIYKSLPVSGARRLSYKEDASLSRAAAPHEHKSMSAMLEVDRVDVSVGDGASPDNNTHVEDFLGHPLLEQLADQNKLLTEEITKLKKELALNKESQAEMLINLSSLEKEYKNKGFDEGYREGRSKAIHEEKQKLESLAVTLDTFDQRLNGELLSITNDAILLAYEALMLIVGEHYKTPEFIKAVIDSALSKITDKKNIRLHLSKFDFELIKQMMDQKIIDFRNPIEIVADERIKLGGCIIETGNGLWDARLESQLERIKDALILAQEGQNK